MDDKIISNSFCSSHKNENENNKNSQKNKILYKFQILNTSPKKEKLLNKCYLINLDFITKNNMSVKDKIRKTNPNKSQDTKSSKLPLIKFKQKSIPLNTLTSSTKKISDDTSINRIINNGPKTIQVDLISSFMNPLDPAKTAKNNKSGESLNDSNEQLITDLNNNRKRINDIIEKINQRYFIRKSTVKYLTNLFFDGNRDLKYVNLSKIKGRRQPECYFYKNKNTITKNEIYRNNYNLYNKKMTQKKVYNTFKGKTIDRSQESNKVIISHLNKKLKSFHDLRIKQCKQLVDNTLNDLNKKKQKNLIFIENFKKSCDFKFDDF